jgi:Mg/Co/Ni transporter MgtE
VTRRLVVEPWVRTLKRERWISWWIGLVTGILVGMGIAIVLAL